MIGAFICVALLLGITACRATGTVFHDLPAFDSFDRSQLVIFRKKQIADSGSCYTIMVDDEELGVLSNGGFLQTFVEPGTHTVSIPHIRQNVLSVQVESVPGGTSYLEYNSILEGVGAIPAGNIVGVSVGFTFVLAEVTQDYGSAAVHDLRDSSEKRRCMATVRSR